MPPTGSFSRWISAKYKARLTIVQRYYNVSSADALGQQAELDTWFTVFEPLNDHLDAAICSGTGYIIRRKALDEIGGWPFISAGEDCMCLTMLADAEWRVAFVNECVQQGLAPESMWACISQKNCWVNTECRFSRIWKF